MAGASGVRITGGSGYTEFSCSPHANGYEGYAMSDGFTRTSLTTTGGPGRAPNRAMLRAVGFIDDDFDRPMIGVAVAVQRHHPVQRPPRPAGRARACEGIRAGGGVPQIVRRPDRSDGIMMGHKGMRYSPRVAARSSPTAIEVVAGGMNHDGVLAFGGCDKNMPGCVMAMARLNVPSVFVYGGSILPGVGADGEDVDIVSIFEAVGQFQAGTIDAKTLHKVECESCPGAGSCGGMYTANTMSSAIEAMGMSLPYDASNPAVSRRQGARGVPRRQGRGAAASRRTSARATSSPASRWRTPTRFVLALGGSTNAVLHLMAIAREAGVAVDARRLRPPRRRRCRTWPT